VEEYFLDEGEDGSLILYRQNGEELARFEGETALQKAIHWAHHHGLRLSSTINPAELADYYRYRLRRMPRFLRLHHFRRMNAPLDSANVKRIVVENEADFHFEDDPDEFEFFFQEDVYLAPKDADEDDEDDET
jgi:hypothetical protein